MLLFLDRDFSAVRMTEEYRDFIWNRRFDRPGDFSVVLPVGEIAEVKKAAYLYHPGNGEIGVVTDLTAAKTEKGTVLTVKGRFAEILLFDRVIASPTTLDGQIESEVLRLVRENAMTGARAIPALKGTETVGVSGTVTAQACGVTLGQFLYDLLLPFGYAPRMRFDGENGFLFSLRKGTDRTQGEETAVFSASFENLDTFRYERKIGNAANVAWVAGALIGGERTVVRTEEIPEGEERREIYVSAYDLRPENGMSDAKYRAALAGRGRMALRLRRAGIESLEGRSAALSGEGRGEYDLGDTVLAADRNCGVSAALRIVGITEYGTGEEKREELVFGSLPSPD